MTARISQEPSSTNTLQQFTSISLTSALNSDPIILLEYSLISDEQKGDSNSEFKCRSTSTLEATLLEEIPTLT
jgi:hypothetical protein